MNRIVINGKTISASGRNVSIINNRVIVDGKDVTPDLAETKEINIMVEGPIERLQVDACNKIGVRGNVGSIKTQSGNVDILSGNVQGSVQTMSGDVTCGNIAGSVSTMSGNIKQH